MGTRTTTIFCRARHVVFHNTKVGSECCLLGDWKFLESHPNVNTLDLPLPALFNVPERFIGYLCSQSVANKI